MKRIVFGLLSSFALTLGCSAAVDESDESIASSNEALGRHHHCERNSDCGRNQYCELKAGACGGVGTCRQEPRLCPDIYEPVCGCNGATYGNACEAAAAGVSVAESGACPSVSCGGIAGIACPGAGKCVDDPNDGCDPANGGADCGGICQCVENVLCTVGSHFDSSPKVCACVPDQASNPCAAVTCPTGTACIVSGGTASCEPADTGEKCGQVTCGKGTYCCNASCGWCVPPGMACIQIACQ